MISKQAHLVVQRIQEEQHLKSSLKEKDKEIDSLHDIVINLEVRLEHQEQYSRRTSLRFHHIDVPVDDRGHISTNDISRSHVIGKVRNGKSQVIVRFLSYRCREKVYNSKRNLKNDADRIFITENLTKTKTNLVKSLADLKYNQNIKTCLIYIIVRGIK
jgi:NCAIR mutase (PurE)-related protein